MKKLILVISFLLFSSTVHAVPILNPINQNYYELITTEVGWLDAKTNSESLNFMGRQWRLTTITSQDENDFISNNFVSLTKNIWLGGF